MPTSVEEHDYIGLTEISRMENSEKSNMSSRVNEKNGKGLNFKATELRLGLPGSESPERDNGHGHGLLLKGCGGFVSGAKRGFADTINGVGSGGGGSGKWGLSVGIGSEVDLNGNRNGGLFSPRSVNSGGGSEGNAQKQSFTATSVVKEGVGQTSKPVVQEKKPQQAQPSAANPHGVAAPAAKAQVVGWPPIRSFRKNSMAINPPKTDEDADAKSGANCLYVKVSMDGAPYLRKVDLETYISYKDLSSALEKMFSCFTIGQCGSQVVPNRDGVSESGLKDLLEGSEYVLTYEDKDGDWMLVGDVPWEMFVETCKRLRIMKSSDAIGLAPRTMEKCKSHN